MCTNTATVTIYKFEINMVKRLWDISNQTADADANANADADTDADADRETAVNLYVSPWGGET